jgi:predicted phosphodiesterase
LSFPLSFPEPDPSYSPDEFDLEENFNVLHISEIHAFEPEYNKSKYLERVGRQIDSYSDFYDIDRVSVLGDTGSIDDVEEVFSYVDDDVELWIIAGDEDKKNNSVEDGWIGWFEGANDTEPFDIGNDYRIFDEGYETEIRGHTIQAAHHPKNSKRENSLSIPDSRVVGQEESIDNEPKSPEELYEEVNKEGFLESLFSVDRDSNERKEPLPLETSADVCLYDHVHMPYPRKLYDTAVIGLGGRSHNYQTKADSMPKRSFHITSFDDELVHALHFDSDKDEIFEHEIFDFEEELEMYFVPTPDEKTNQSTYLSLQSRFLSTQIDEDEARETVELQPDMWSNRE